MCQTFLTVCMNISVRFKTVIKQKRSFNAQKRSGWSEKFILYVINDPKRSQNHAYVHVSK